MQLDDFKALIREQSLQDLWWLALDDTVLDEQLTLEQIAQLKKEKPKSTFSLLNIAFTEEPDAEWVDLDDIPQSVTQAPFSADATGGAVMQELRALKERMDAMQDFLQQIHAHFIAKENLELKEVELKEREKFLEESEEALLQKIQQQEEQLAELDQIREDIDDEVEKKSELRAV